MLDRVTPPPAASDRRERILGLWSVGASAAEICAEIGDGLTRNAVLGLVHRARAAGDPRAAWRATTSLPPRIDAGRVLEAWATGATAHAIADSMGLSVSTVTGIVGRERFKGDPRARARAPRRAPARRAFAPPSPPADFAEGPGAPLMQASARGCRWVVGCCPRGVALFCDAPRLPGGRFSWCAGHYARGVSRGAPAEACA